MEHTMKDNINKAGFDLENCEGYVNMLDLRDPLSSFFPKSKYQPDGNCPPG
jgi:hypothetical protein